MTADPMTAAVDGAQTLAAQPVPAQQAVMFPGQGTQRLGMGRTLQRACAASAAVFETADQVLDRDVRGLCFTGPAREQTLTQNAQVAVFTCNAAALAALRDAGHEPMAALGHSVGELNALHAAGVISLEDGLRLVAARGELMGRIEAPGAMLAVLGLEQATVDRLCLQASVQTDGVVVPALLNGPCNVVVSGSARAVAALGPSALAAGAVKVSRLVVSHAFHSPLMQPAVAHWAAAVARAQLSEPRIPVLLNTTGRPARDVDDIRAALVDQLTGPVRWVADVRAAVCLGARLLVEAGDAKVLTGLARAIDPDVPAWTMNDPRTVRRLTRAGTGRRG